MKVHNVKFIYLCGILNNRIREKLVYAALKGIWRNVCLIDQIEKDETSIKSKKCLQSLNACTSPFFQLYKKHFWFNKINYQTAKSLGGTRLNPIGEDSVDGRFGV